MAAPPANPRIVAPELLDELPASDPRAVGSRGDLIRLNAIMGHAGVLARLWRQAQSTLPAGPVERLVEFGAGDGTLCRRLLKRLPPVLRPRRVTMIDRQSLLSDATRAGIERLGVRVDVAEADVFDWLGRGEQFDVGLANLFLHHFEDSSLRRLLEETARAGRVFIAVEPRRSVLSGLASRMLALVGCNAVTRHDAVVSVRAGFSGRELSQLWPTDPGWKLVERRAGLFSHALLATKR